MRMPRRTALALATIAVLIAPAPARTEARAPHVDADVLAAAGPIDALARFERAIPDLAAIGGLRVIHRFRTVPAVHIRVTPAAVRALAARDDLVFLERDHPISWDIDTATTATRAKEIWGADPPVVHDGKVVDGSGVGIAVVDSGLDGLHPDFAAAGKVGGNWLVRPDGDVVDLPHTALLSTHGTHVSGIAAGSGLASEGVNRGAAPGATLYSFAVNHEGGVSFAARAFEWILEHGDDQSPPIRVVNNSWHCASQACATFNEGRLHMLLASKLAESGVVITWAAGNVSGDGVVPTTSVEARNRTPGIVSVTNYNDDDRGLRNKCVVGYASYGAALDPTTWPDVAAPGHEIISTWAAGVDVDVPPTQPNPRTPGAGPVPGDNLYREASGTSMAAPHAAGIVALLLQVRPDLTPGEVEYLLKATAYKFGPCKAVGGSEVLPYVKADPSHPYGGANYVNGHGLVDAVEALAAARAFAEMPPAPEVEPLPDSFHRLLRSVRVEETLYLRGDALSPDKPQQRFAAPRPLVGDTPQTFTSAPFAEAKTVSGLTAFTWIGLAAEMAVFRALQITDVEVRFERVTADGATELARLVQRPYFSYPMYPTYREWIAPLGAPVTFDAGDRIRFSITHLDKAGAPAPWDLYVDAQETPSQIGIGARIDGVEPNSDEHCLVRYDCVGIGGDVHFAQFYCDDGPGAEVTAMVVEWYGPPGSTGFVQCHGYVIASCTIPGEATDPWSSCVAESVVEPYNGSHMDICAYLSPGAELIPAARGQCRSKLLGRDDP